MLRRSAQPLRFKTVAAVAECGVSVRVAFAIAAYLLLAILKKTLPLSACLGALGEMFALTVLEKKPAAQAVSQPPIQNSKCLT